MTRASPERLAVLDEVELTVEKLVAGGDGFARFEGIPIFVARAAPGDRLRVKVTERKPDYGRAEIVEILQAGNGRREPKCPHFGACGGCDLQHLEDAVQVELKAEAVRETLVRLGGVQADISIETVSGDAWSYRLRTQIHTARTEDQLESGYLGRRSHDVVPIETCPVLLPALEKAVVGLNAVLVEHAPRRIDLMVGDENELNVAPPLPGLAQHEASIVVGDFTYAVDARCFFQAHRQLLPALVGKAIGEWTGEVAYDLYAGVGLLTLPLASKYSRVVAVESDRMAVRFARRNAQVNKATAVEHVGCAVESWIDALPADVPRVVLDPPRTGLSAKVRQVLRQRPPQRLTYVSCHPATLARDLKMLGSVYRIEQVIALDMFPQTGHMEVVVQAERQSSG